VDADRRAGGPRGLPRRVAGRELALGSGRFTSKGGTVPSNGAIYLGGVRSIGGQLVNRQSPIVNRQSSIVTRQSSIVNLVGALSDEDAGARLNAPTESLLPTNKEPDSSLSINLVEWASPYVIHQVKPTRSVVASQQWEREPVGVSCRDIYLVSKVAH